MSSRKGMLGLILPLCGLFFMAVTGFKSLDGDHTHPDQVRLPANESRLAAWQAATPTAVSTVRPTVNPTPPSLMPERYQERNPGLLVGAILIVAVVMIGLLVNIRKR